MMSLSKASSPTDAISHTRQLLALAARHFHSQEGRPARVLVGLSGGVDSSVAAALLVQAGFEVVGAYMKNWILDVPGMRCPWADDLADAKRVAVRLNIDFTVYDFQDIYKRDVVDYLVSEYKAGRTPNPDIMCNQDVKFGAFLDAANNQGFDFIATGHYARTSVLASLAESAPDSSCSAQLLCAADPKKDQTYFLYRMQQKAVAQTLFPLGLLQKSQVRSLAEEFGLDTAEKPDSQGICFVGEAGIRDFLSLYVKPAPGPIIDEETGNTIGYHDGAINFTIGQRKGLGIGGGAQYYVVRKDMTTNTVYVRSGKALAPQENQVVLENLSWISGVSPFESADPHQLNAVSNTGVSAHRFLVRTHHGETLHPARLVFGTPSYESSEERECSADKVLANKTLGATNAPDVLLSPTCSVVFETPHEVVAAGQSVVVYDGEICLGGGIVR